MPRITLAAALIVAAAAAGFALGKLWGPAASDFASAQIRAGAGPTAVAEPSRRNARPPARTLPGITFVDRRGAPRRFSDWRGRPLLVNFWAPWCAPCRAEVPLLERLSRARTDGVEVIGVAVDRRAAVLRYARHAAIRYPLLIGTRTGMEAIHALGMVAVFPFSVFVDARGRIVTLKVGALRAAQARWILNRIAALDQGRIDLTTARRQIAHGMIRLAIRRSRLTS
jgi:thiol-disulfide isomerase/thioredoxin